MGMLAALGVIALVGGFVVYPAQAKSRSHDAIQKALDDIAREAGVKLGDVKLTTTGNNAFVGLTGGPQVASVVLRIGTIRAPDGSADRRADGSFSGSSKPPDRNSIKSDVEDLYDELKKIGSFTLVIGAVEADGRRVDFEDSSFSIGEDRYRVNINFSKRSVDKLLDELDLSAKITADGHDIELKVSRENPIAPGREKLNLSAEPINAGAAIRYRVNGESSVEKLNPADGVTVTEIDFDSSREVYTVTVGGGYRYAAIKRSIDDAFKSPAISTWPDRGQMSPSSAIPVPTAPAPR